MTLTRDEIMAMTPEELRVAIAKKKGIENINCDREGDWFGISVRGNHATAFFRDWITDIAAAWELVEEIRRGGDEITLNSDRRGNGSAIYSVVVLRLRNDNIGTGWTQIVNSEADTASLAISRAWLIWSEESGK